LLKAQRSIRRNHSYNKCPETSKFSRLREENEQLRQVFDTAVDEFNKLNRRIEQLEEELNCEKEQSKHLKKRNRQLEHELRNERGKANKFASMIFGLKSEKLKLSEIKVEDENSIAIEETSESETKNVGEEESAAEKDNEKKKRKAGGQNGHKGNGRKIPEGLPVVDRIIHLPEGEVIYKIPAENWIEQSGMDEISYMIRKKVEWYVERIIRRKYTPPADCGPDVPKIITALMPAKLIPQGKYGLEIWIDILIDKYQQHIPVQRQIFDMWQHHVNMIPGTAFGGLKTLFETYLNPLYEELIIELRNGTSWHADETRWYMLCDAMKKLWYMWGFKSEDVTVFVLDATRSASVPAETLLGITDIAQIKEPIEIPEEKMKILNVDRYSAYKMLANLGLVILSYCWAHVRRDFTDILKKYPEENALLKWAEEWLLKIAELYRINNERVTHSPRSKIFLEYDTQLRDAITKMEKEINVELETDENEVHEARLKAMVSMNNHWGGLIVFVDNSEIPMDNNRMENGIRPCALGRNNYLGNHSKWGGKLSACMYSIIQTCKQNNINPKAYLRYYFEKCIEKNGNTSREKINSMLPGKLKEDIIANNDLGLKKF
jgi:transposase